MQTSEITILQPKAGADFVETPFVKGIQERALHYLNAGFPVHFRGISGTGKTTSALRVAELLERPVIMVHGDEQLTTNELVGAQTGYHVRKLRDNFIASVLKVEEDSSKRWVDNRLTVAVENGYTLIYDEFTRSRPEANNVLLSVLQEGILDLPGGGRDDGESCIKVHPNFRAIFTSNPEEYAGVHRSQDALRDRMVTLDLEPFDEETECAITARRSGLPKEVALKIVKIVRYLREHGQYEFAPTIRGCIMIAKTVQDYRKGISLDPNDPIFKQICLDVLCSETSRIGSKTTSAKVKEVVEEAIHQFGSNGKKQKGK
ncbi:MAG: gas vesicle protein GvpN [Chlamydiae bacterium]|nr:gas vesicle protein GvpN [Chlamydiota bacterium]MBI3277882.1 gas vesicle protein GvpN [Chlamydiota bacterium]